MSWKLIKSASSPFFSPIILVDVQHWKVLTIFVAADIIDKKLIDFLQRRPKKCGIAFFLNHRLGKYRIEEFNGASMYRQVQQPLVKLNEERCFTSGKGRLHA